MECPVFKLKVGDRILFRKAIRKITNKTVTQGYGGNRVLLKFSDSSQVTLPEHTWVDKR